MAHGIILRYCTLYNFLSQYSRYDTQTIPDSYAPKFSETDLEAMQYIWGTEEGGMWGNNNGYDPITNVKEYSLFADLHDDGIFN